MKKLLVLLLLAGAAGAVYWYKFRPAADTGKKPEAARVQVARGSIFQAVSASGRVVSNLDVDIKCRASGQIVKLPYDVSQTVKKDDLLMQLDPIDQERAVNLSQATVDQSQARLAQARQNLRVAEQNLVTAKQRAEASLKAAEIRAKDLHEKAEWRTRLFGEGTAAYEEYTTAVTDAALAESDLRSAQAQMEDMKTQELSIEVRKEDIKLAEAQLRSDQVALANAKQQLTYTTVTAPIDGVVSALNVQIGMIIASGITNVAGGTTIMTLSDLSHVFVLAAVDESDIGNVAIDQPAIITVDAYPGRRFDGKVVRIATKGVNVTNVVTFEVKIEVLSKDRALLKPEMTANVQIVSAQRDNVLVVPSNAVTRKGRQAVVNVVGPAGAPVETPVKVGLTDGERWEIREGLTEGQTILVRSEEAPSRWRSDQMRPGGGFGLIPGMRGGGGGGGGRRGS